MHSATLYRGHRWMEVRWPEAGTTGRTVRVRRGREGSVRATSTSEGVESSPYTAAVRARSVIASFISDGWIRQEPIGLQGPAVTVEPVDTEEESTSTLSGESTSSGSSIDLIGASRPRVVIDDDDDEESSSSSDSHRFPGETISVVEMSMTATGIDLNCVFSESGMSSFTPGQRVGVGTDRGLFRLRPTAAMAGFYGEFTVSNVTQSHSNYPENMPFHCVRVSLVSDNPPRVGREYDTAIPGSGLASLQQQATDQPVGTVRAGGVTVEGSTLAWSSIPNPGTLDVIEHYANLPNTRMPSQSELWDVIAVHYPKQNDRRHAIQQILSRRRDILAAAERLRRVRELELQESMQRKVREAEEVLRDAAELAASRGDFSKPARMISLEDD